MKRTDDKENDPDSSELNHRLYKLGCNHFKKGEFKKAAKAFSESLQYWPQDAQAWFALGDCYDELNKPVKAEECFRKSIEYGSTEKNYDAYYNLGNSLMDQLKYNEAVDCFNKVSGQSTVYRKAQINMEISINAINSKNS
jgi:tetratricopeptide (TPR) repeat protein